MTRRAVFLDRDGTLIVDHGYTSQASQVELLPGVIPALKAIQAADYLLIIISNQSGVGRGYFSKIAVEQVNQRLQNLLLEQGILINGIYYCPHRPNDGCTCRKPEPGLVFQAMKEHQIGGNQSYFVGDKWTDVETAIAAGVKPVWLAQRDIDGSNYPLSITVTNSLLSWTKLINLEDCDDTYT
jgi:D-glycero-D-manno-heptose 1,7-bisphosphate phosphatase